MARKRGIGCGAVLATLVAIGLVATYFLGPTMGMAFGRPIFMGHVSPERYTESVLSLADSQGYYTDSPEYAEARQAAVQAANDAESLDDVHEPLKLALKAAGGKHSNLVPPDEPGDSGQDGGDNGDVPPAVTHDGPVAVATVPEFDGFSGDHQTYADTLANGLNDAVQAGACGAVVDLRGNGGGDMGPMVAGLSGLLPDGPVLEFVGRDFTSEVTVSGSAVQGGGTAVTAADHGKLGIPVAVLVDDGTASSGEATMLAFRGLDNSRSFGQPTAGYASGNLAVEMPDGAIVMITNSYDRDRTGQTYGDDPVEPDEVTDDADAAARQWLANEHRCGM